MTPHNSPQPHRPLPVSCTRTRLPIPFRIQLRPLEARLSPIRQIPQNPAMMRVTGLGTRMGNATVSRPTSRPGARFDLPVITQQDITTQAGRIEGAVSQVSPMQPRVVIILLET